MAIQKYYHKYERMVSDLATCILIALCLCLPAQSQIIKIPFLGAACVLGAVRLWLTRGKAISKATWIWFGGYLAYNLIWSLMGIFNGYRGASDYFRLGVIWPVLFFFITACITVDTVKWITRVIVLVVGIQTVCVYILIGNVFQLWPNFLRPIYPDSAVGLHPGYIHVVSHFIGAMAFTVPFVYAYFLLHQKLKLSLRVLLLVAWFLIVLALVATSRRILLVVLVVCAASVIVIPFLLKERRGQMLLRTVAGLGVTVVFMLAATGIVINASTGYLTNNFDAVLKVIQNRADEQTTIRYTSGLVYDLGDIEPPREEDPDCSNGAEESVPGTNQTGKPTKPGNEQVGNNGFKDRVDGLFGELDSGTVRGKILAGALGNWTKSPIVGVGFGAPLPGFEGPGDGIYEMEYVVRLYTSGLLGIAILVALMLFVGVAPLRKICKENDKMLLLAPCTVAYLGAAVATISNPYIFSGFDYLLMLFLPVAFLNSANTGKKTIEGKGC